MKKVAVFPGSFDPVTNGHKSIVLRALPLFDKIIVAVGINAEKAGFFSVEQRVAWLKKVFQNYPEIEIDTYTGLTVDYCKKNNIRYILRGLRTSADFEFERGIGQMNKKMMPAIETVFLLTTPEHTALTSSIIRDIIKNGGDVSAFVPEEVKF
jgi:pantetheine-phosphate adenylyltransferase